MCDGYQVRVSGHLARVAVVVAVLLGVAVPGYAERGDSPVAERAMQGDRQADQIDRASKQVLDDTYQPELPRYRTEPAGSGDGTRTLPWPRRQAGGELDEDDQDRRVMIDARDHEAQGATSSLMTFLMWGMVIVIGVLFASWIASELSRYGGDAALSEADDSQDRMQAAADAIIDRPLGDADELARRGLFAEAIHTLLLRTLQELVRSAAVRVAPAMTSREILGRVPLLADARTAFAGLITTVEITHFGDEPANAADYERCRQQFHVFAAAFRTGGQVPGQAVAG
jgi:Domain of unknown function (DUF4129)